MKHSKKNLSTLFLYLHCFCQLKLFQRTNPWWKTCCLCTLSPSLFWKGKQERNTLYHIILCRDELSKILFSGIKCNEVWSAEKDHSWFWTEYVHLEAFGYHYMSEHRRTVRPSCKVLPFGSLWVSSCMSNCFANAVRSGGITQQEARFTWLLLGFTWK